MLIGFMGSGKSTLGPLLASRLGVPFVDLDDEIESRAACRIAELVQRSGEQELRRHEIEALRALVRTAPQRCVVATGGGVVETPAAHPLLRELGRLVWLHAEPEASVARLGSAARAIRPLLGTGGEWRGRWERREPLYRELAQDIVSTHPESVDESLEQLVRLVRGAVA